ncbi:MAG TPA: GDP-mannose 4,6-dehydratase [Burkholderiales bacterium]|nr:GDP-mannose 4,6-dehydratase [Burkholderiales bacterium]
MRKSYVQPAFLTLFVFASTASVYGEPRYVPMAEAHPTEPINPYGAAKRSHR